MKHCLMDFFNYLHGYCVQLIWDEVGETNEERDKMLLDIEQECLQVYHRKVDAANRSRTSLHQLLAEIHSQIVAFASALGELPPVSQVSHHIFKL